MTTQPIIPIIAALAGILVAIVLAAWLFRRRDPARRLDRVMKRLAHDQVRDIVIPDGVGGNVYIERVLLTGQGALVVDFKPVAGVVFAGERLDEWAIMDKRGRHPLRNPLGPLQDRIAAVRALSPGLPVDGRVVFSDRSEFPKGRPERVDLLREFAAHTHPAGAQWHLEAWGALKRQVSAPAARAAPST